jgi:hypothetical protein
MEAGRSTIVIENDYQWMLDPRWGRLTAYVDHRRVGSIDLHGELSLELSADEAHEIRVRLWWYRSPIVRVTLEGGETRHLSADIRRDQSFLRRMAILCFRPSTGLRLGERVES